MTTAGEGLGGHYKGRDPAEPRASGHLCGYRSIAPGWLDGRDVLRLHALLALGRLVRDLGALIEALEAVAGYARVVHEEILATLVGGDEAVALLVVEPLYRSLGHVWSPPFSWGFTAIKKPLLSHRGRRFTHHKTHSYLLHPYYTTTKGRSPVGAGHNEGRAAGWATQRGRGQYRGWGPTPSFAAAREPYPSRELPQRRYTGVYCG